MDPITTMTWFRRDLRVHDHPALVAASETADRLVPLYVIDPRLIHGRFASPVRTWFLLEALRALRQAFRERGSDLVVRVGDPREVVPAVAREVGAGAVHVSADHAPYGRARDAVVAAALAADDIAWLPHPGILIHEPDEVLARDRRPFSIYSPFRRAWASVPVRAVLPAPDRLPPLPAGMAGTTAVGDVPTLTALGMELDATLDPGLLPEPGATAARQRLERWAERGVDAYADSRDRMDLDGTSRLSADLHLGLVSPLQVAVRTSGAGEGRRVFANELAWREFYAHVLAHRPSVRTASFHPDFDSIAWSDDDAAFRAWTVGGTGYPIVDAGMRQLATTGWMHNRARMIVASFLTKDLLIDWRWGESHFMRHLVDGDVASNNGGWQWAASTGTDAQPYFRIFNPVLQGRRFDPDGAYVRRWVPELVRVPTRRIHAPWEMSSVEQAAARCRIGSDYPGPIVDHAQARARAIAVYGAARRTS